MLTPDGPASDAAACDFLEMLDRDRARGNVRARAEYLARFPGHEARIRRELDALAEQPPAPAVVRRLGRYRLVRELGRGGQAVVHLAHDEHLDRPVALKVLVEGAGWQSQSRRERLQREASALARLDHPGICAIHEADLAGETPFLAMRYVAGETLAARLQRARVAAVDGEGLLACRPDSTAHIALVLAMGEMVARALHSAHEAGVVHRDIKPGNVMLTRDDEPVILDFGIASTDDAAELVRTRTGELFGSLAYLAPERLSGNGTADRRGDVYALGVTLYECLTLRRPFEATTATALLAAIGAGRAVDPVRHNRALPRDVVLVLETALEPDPSRRYPTALALAEDLRRLRHHEPIAARPIPIRLRVLRWTRRHPVVAVAGVLLVAALVLSTGFLVQLAAQRDRLLAWQQVLEALSARDQPVAALGRVLAAAPHVPEAQLNGPLIELLAQSTVVLELSAERLGAAPAGTAIFAAGDRILAVPTAAGELVEIDVESGTVLRRRDIHGAPFVLRVDAAGEVAITSGMDGRVRRFDVAGWSEQPLPDAVVNSNREILSAPAPARLPRAPVLSPAGDRFLLLGYDGSLLGGGMTGDARVWRQHRENWWVRHACFVRGGTQVVVGWSGPREQGASDVRVLASVDGGEVARLETGGQESTCFASDAAGARLCVGCADGVVRVFDTSTWRSTVELHAGGEDLRDVYWVGFTPAGDGLVTLGFEGLTVWDLARRERRARVVAAGGRPFHVGAFGPDGARFAAVVKDGTVRVFDTADWSQVSTARWSHRYPDELTWNAAGTRLAFQDGRGLHVMSVVAAAPDVRVHREAITSLAWTADGRRVLTASRDGTAALVDLATGRREVVLPHAAPVRRARLSADGHRIATACEDGGVRMWSMEGARASVMHTWRAHAGAVHDVQFVPGDGRLLSLGADGGVHVFDPSTGTATDLRSHRGACLCAAIDADLGFIATGGADDQVLVHDLAGRFVAALPTLPSGVAPAIDLQGDASALAFDAVRRRLVVANRRDVLVVYALDDWKATWVAPRTQGQEYSAHVALIAGGRYYATAHSGVGDWTFVDADTLVPHDVGAGHFPAAIVAALRFSPDARLLLVAARDDSVSLWDLAARARHLDLRGNHGGVRAAEFSPDGTWVATGSQDGVLRAWPVRPLPFAQRYWQRAAGR